MPITDVFRDDIGIGGVLSLLWYAFPWSDILLTPGQVPAPLASLRLQVSGNVSHDYCRPRPCCLRGTQHHRGGACGKGLSILAVFWSADHCKIALLHPLTRGRVIALVVHLMMLQDNFRMVCIYSYRAYLQSIFLRLSYTWT